MFGLVLLSVSADTADLVTLKFKVNEYPPLAISPYPVGPSTTLAVFYWPKTKQCIVPWQQGLVVPQAA